MPIDVLDAGLLETERRSLAASANGTSSLVHSTVETASTTPTTT